VSNGIKTGQVLRKKLSFPYKNFSAKFADTKGRMVFLILMVLPVFLNKSFAFFLDRAIYMEFQALCQVNIGNKKKKMPRP
jgi:hypothetical protein